MVQHQPVMRNEDADVSRTQKERGVYCQAGKKKKKKLPDVENWIQMIQGEMWNEIKRLHLEYSMKHAFLTVLQYAIITL